jgi:protein-tyrosine phosphatase
MELELVNFGTLLHWVSGPWLGRLALAARPRGGDWLADEMAGWRRSGIDMVFSLHTREEERDLDLTKEREEVKARAMEFISFPIADCQVPASESSVRAILGKLDAELSSGRNIIVHCRQGVGRTGLVASCLLVAKGQEPEAAVNHLSTVRGIAVPETAEQRRWIDHYAAATARKIPN